MAKQKKINKIIDAVHGIMGDKEKYRKVKKAKALKRFIDAMEQKRVELEAEVLQRKEKSNDDIKRNLMTLDKQIKKANKILKEIS